MQQFKISDDIFLIMDFWTKEKCAAFIAKSEDKGYHESTIDTGRGHRIVKSMRNNKRVIYFDPELAADIWKDLSAFAPATIGNSTAVGLNEMFRFYKYNPGEEFKKHRDQSYIRDNLDASYYTLMIYLNDGFEGGETTFPDRNVRPVTGMALIFLHSLEHAGSPIKRGTKYVLRTDIMYRLNKD